MAAPSTSAAVNLWPFGLMTMGHILPLPPGQRSLLRAARLTTEETMAAQAAHCHLLATATHSWQGLSPFGAAYFSPFAHEFEFF